MARVRWLLVPLLALALVSVSGVAQSRTASAASLYADEYAPLPAPGGDDIVVVLGGGEGSRDGDPDDWIDGNRANAISVRTETSVRVCRDPLFSTSLFRRLATRLFQVRQLLP